MNITEYLNDFNQNYSINNLYLNTLQKNITFGLTIKLEKFLQSLNLPLKFIKNIS